MDSEMIVLMPYPEGIAGVNPKLAPRRKTLQGQTIGIINNGWICMDIAADELKKLLVAECGVVEFIEKRTSVREALRPADFEDMVNRADAVVCGMGT